MRMWPSRLLRPQSTFSSSLYRPTSCTPRWTGAIHSPIRQRAGLRHTSSETGEDDSGHISKKQDEGILFFDNIFPLRLQWFLRIPFINVDQSLPTLMKRFDNPGLGLSDPVGIIKRALPDGLPMKVTEIMPRIREGGAFVKFSHDSSVSPEELEGTIKQYLKEKPIKPWFNPFHGVRSFLVRGTPWIEDLSRFPSSRLRIEFLPTKPENAPAELNQETLYTLFRRYGKIAEIMSQPSDSKVFPRYAYVHYTRLRFATLAKNTMHGYVLGEEAGGGKTGTLLRLSYEKSNKSNWIWDWILNHPRIVIPALAALIAALSVTIFDPIRTASIKFHITHGQHLLSDNHWFKYVRGLVLRSYDYLRLRKPPPEDEGLKIIWQDRQSAIQQLQTWMIETADTFIVIQGPRGSGKKELVMDQALKDKPYKLVIDCKRIQEARGDSRTINAAANEVGYRPVFSWMNSISSLVDLAAMGTIGAKTGFSETVDNQLAKIWANTSTALKKIALESRRKDDKDAQLGDDEWLEAHPETRPVVVIDNFLHKSNEDSAGMVYDKLAEWAATLTTQNVAHVVFLTTEVSFSKSLSKAMPDRVFRQITLGDVPPEVAKKMVVRHLNIDIADSESNESKVASARMQSDIDELDSVIQVIGGRLTDLEFLARRIKSGETPGRAVQQIIEQSASEILKMYLLDPDRKWTPQQAWLLIKELAANENLKYNEFLLNDIFKDGDSVLQSLEQAEMITITSKNGRPNYIKPGRPVYLAAFQFLSEDEVLKSRLDLAILSQLIGIENKNVEKFENELRLLADLPGAPAELKPRIHWLLDKAAASHAKVEKYEAESTKLKKVLKDKA